MKKLAVGLGLFSIVLLPTSPLEASVNDQLAIERTSLSLERALNSRSQRFRRWGTQNLPGRTSPQKINESEDLSTFTPTSRINRGGISLQRAERARQKLIKHTRFGVRSFLRDETISETPILGTESNLHGQRFNSHNSISGSEKARRLNRAQLSRFGIGSLSKPQKFSEAASLRRSHIFSNANRINQHRILQGQNRTTRRSRLEDSEISHLRFINPEGLEPGHRKLIRRTRY
jgi:hypothetical protein